MAFSTRGVSLCAAYEKALMSFSGPFFRGVVLGVRIPYGPRHSGGNLIFSDRCPRSSDL
jgi:hypothetical protein